MGQAAVWGDGADALLDWLEIRRRHRVESDRLSGLVLLDLPDFDSVETAHRLEVNRIVELADLLVWVVEPQKYADAALHRGYLRPLATHGGSMAVVLNQIDLLAPNETDALQHDTARLIAQDGLMGDTRARDLRTNRRRAERTSRADRAARRHRGRLPLDDSPRTSRPRRTPSADGAAHPGLRRVEPRDREVLVTALSKRRASRGSSKP